jgi:protein-S-isoprenylcysteine O-methyltransferase Ste14
MHLRTIVLAALGVLFGRQLWVATSTFRIIPDDGPRPQRVLIPLSILTLWYLGYWSPLYVWLVFPGVLIAICSLVLLEWSRMSVRGQYFSYLFSQDVPRFLWSSGPYAYIRHPFYASYLLAYLAAALILPGVISLLVLIVTILFYSAAAASDERKFAGSALAAEYDAYKRRTGRFLPRLEA